MIAPVTPVTTGDSAANTLQQESNYSASLNDVRTFDRHDIADIIKAFVLRHFVKKEVKENENQQILTDVTLYDLNSNTKIYGHNEDTEHFAASINKLPVTLLLIENLKAGTNGVTLDTTVSWSASDVRAGNGIYDQPGAVTTATVRQVLFDMLNRSGNTAVRILVNKVLGGNAAVNARFAAKPQLSHTYLIPLDADRFYLGNTTSKDSLWTLREIMKEGGSYATVVKNMLATNIFVNDGVRSQLAGNDYITLVNKTGLLYDPDGNNVHDVGIVYNTKTGKSYGYSVLTTTPSADGITRGEQSIKNIGKYFLRYAGDKPVQNNAAKQPQTLRSAPATQPETKVLY